MRERYLIEVDVRRVPALTPDVLVIGGGVAGLSAALAASEQGATVAVLLKNGPEETATARAQGGVAVSLSDEDSAELHLADTIEAGAGLVDEQAARKVVTEGPARVRELLEWGTRFDRENGRLAFTREAAHSRRRILHSNGDATGREIERSLHERASNDQNVTVIRDRYVIDLLHAEGRVYGAVVAADGSRRYELFYARGTILASGGAGRIFRETTNPRDATADGYAMAFRAGAALADMEFVQFHPTTLYVAGAPRLLVSEAVRGEGAHLVNTLRERFMTRYHPDGELAPRDVVSASIVREMERTQSPHVYLDLRHLPAERVYERFPGIADTVAMYGFELAKDLIPIRPAAHYMMGGVVVDLDARTNVEGLWACGEVACTGLHGANRLASNSLLEGLVYGRTAGIAASAAPAAGPFPLKKTERGLPGHEVEIDLEDLTRSLRALMTRSVGVFREGPELESALRALRHWREYLMPYRFEERAGFELQNMLGTSTLVARAALLRQESRGAHRRTDFPDRDDERWRRRIEQRITDFD